MFKVSKAKTENLKFSDVYNGLARPNQVLTLSLAESGCRKNNEEELAEKISQVTYALGAVENKFSVDRVHSHGSAFYNRGGEAHLFNSPSFESLADQEIAKSTIKKAFNRTSVDPSMLLELAELLENKTVQENMYEGRLAKDDPNESAKATRKFYQQLTND